MLVYTRPQTSKTYAVHNDLWYVLQDHGQWVPTLHTPAPEFLRPVPNAGPEWESFKTFIDSKQPGKCAGCEAGRVLAEAVVGWYKNKHPLPHEIKQAYMGYQEATGTITFGVDRGPNAGIIMCFGAGLLESVHDRPIGYGGTELEAYDDLIRMEHK